MISAIARVMQPGCQVDHLLVLEGDQGTRKSTALRALVGDDWFRNSSIDLRSKDAAFTLRGCWVYEFDELDAFRGRDATRIKSFITLRVDSYRPPYGRNVVDAPRECAFVGSTNEERYLHDTTGNRRFWPVRCGAIDIPGLTAARAQLWAEAYARYASGELWYVDSPALSAQLAAVQEERREIDPWTTLIERWVADLHENQLEQGVRTVDVLTDALEVKPGQATRHDEMRVAAALKGLGMVSRLVLVKGLRGRRFFFPSGQRVQARLPNLN
jgi:predicted P-loop ATPase